MKIEEIKNHLEKLSIEEIRDIDDFIENLIEIKRVGNVPIGDTFKFLNEEYIVKKSEINSEHPCTNCAFIYEDSKKTCKYLCCINQYRDDNQSVVFVKSEVERKL